MVEKTHRQTGAGTIPHPGGNPGPAYLSRRGFIGRAVALGLSGTALVALLGACGGAQATPSPTAVPTAPPPTPTSAPAGASDAGQAGGGMRVTIDNFTFKPGTLTVPAGTEVTWVNGDDIPHTVASRDKLFNSPPLDTDQQFAYRFTAPGTYRYFCSIHPVMVGQIIVQ